MNDRPVVVEAFQFLWRHRRFHLWFTGSIAVISVIVSLLLPKWYAGTTVILPPKKPLDFAVSALMKEIDWGGLNIGQVSQETKRILAILDSRTLRMRIVERFDLHTLYKKKKIEDTLKELDNNTDIELHEEGTISLTVLDKSPGQAADMSKYFMSELDRINKRLNHEDMRFQREFLEDRYRRNKGDLEGIEDSLRAFQERYGVISLDEQMLAGIQVAANLKIEITQLEIELDTRKMTLGPSHPEILGLQNQLREFRRRYNDLIFEGESAGLRNREGQRLIIPFKDAPELGIRYLRFRRELEVQTVIYELLTQQLELVKIEEARTTPTIQVLDAAVPATKKTKPKRTLIVLLWTAIAFTASVTITLIRDNSTPLS